MDDIFDVERARRLTLLRQSSVSNRIRLNPDTASFLRRYEDADVSRLKLLEAQRLRNESEEQNKLIKLQKKRLKKRLRGGKKIPKGRGIGRNPQEQQQKEVIQKSPLEVEIEREKERAAQKLERDKLRVIATTETLRDRQERDRLQQQGLIARARLQQTAFDNQAERQNNQNIFLGNQAEQQAQRAQQLRIADRDRQARIDDRQQQLLIADAEREDREEDRQVRLAIADISERRLAADSADLRRLNADRLRIQQLQIDNNFQDNQQERALRDRQLAGERERYNVDLARVQADREREVARVNAELEGVRERVAREDAFRHRQLEEQQRLAMEQLAQQRRDNSQQSELERNRIDNQRAVDAERAITDRELIQGFTAAVGALNTQRDQEPAALAPSAEEIADRVRQDLAEGLRAGARAASPLPRPRSSSSSPGPEISELRSRQPPDRLGEFSTDEEAARRLSGQRRQPSGVAATIAELGQSLEEVDDSGSLTDLPTVRIGGGAPLNLSPRSRSSTSSSSSDEQRLPSDSQRTLSIMRSGSRSTTPPRRSRTPDLPARGQVETVAEETTLQQVGGAVGGVVSGAARLAGGAIGGVGQGVYEQLPSAGDVGAAVGRGGVRAVAGVAGAVYEGLVGGEPEEEPIDRDLGGD